MFGLCWTRSRPCSASRNSAPVTNSTAFSPCCSTHMFPELAPRHQGIHSPCLVRLCLASGLLTRPARQASLTFAGRSVGQGLRLHEVHRQPRSRRRRPVWLRLSRRRRHRRGRQGGSLFDRQGAVRDPGRRRRQGPAERRQFPQGLLRSVMEGGCLSSCLSRSETDGGVCFGRLFGDCWAAQA